MNAHRVLFLGATGVEKTVALTALVERYRQRGGSSPSWELVDFERQYLWKEPGSEAVRQSFLIGSLRDQEESWDQAWQKFKQEYLPEQSEQPLFLSLHATFTREHYGVRCVANIESIANDFQPDLIITLITDVYDMWWRTHARAGEEPGQPTLEQLVMARRFEIAVGDQIARGCKGNVKNVMLAASHPLDTFEHCINHPQDHRTVYLSFGITQPRQLELAGNPSARRAVSDFIKEAYKCQRQVFDLVVQCPLGIDEVPFVNSLPNPIEKLLGRVTRLGLLSFCTSEQLRVLLAVISLWTLNHRLPVSLSILAQCLGSSEQNVQLCLKKLTEVKWGLSLPELEWASPNTEWITEPQSLLVETPSDSSLYLPSSFIMAIVSAKPLFKDEQSILFERDSLRWDLSEFWDANERLIRPAPPSGSFPEHQLRNVSGNIFTDVSLRDYRMVDQARCLLVFNPVFNNQVRMAGSVRNEIEHALVDRRKKVYLFQDPDHDAKDTVGTELLVPRVQPNVIMSPPAFRSNLIRVNTLQALLDVLTSGNF